MEFRWLDRDDAPRRPSVQRSRADLYRWLHAPQRPSVQRSRADLYSFLEFFVAREPGGALIWGMTRTRPTITMKTRLAVATAAALLVFPACSGSKNKTEPAVSTSSLLPQSSTSVPSTTPRSTTSAPSQQLVAAVRSFWDLYLQLGARTGPFNPNVTRARLGQRTTGRELTKLFGVFQGNAAAGYVVKGTIDVAPTVVSVSGTTARVRDCYDDHTGLYRISDGKRIDTEDPRRHNVLMTFSREGGAWKVSAIKEEGLGCTV